MSRKVRICSKMFSCLCLLLCLIPIQALAQGWTGDPNDLVKMAIKPRNSNTSTNQCLVYASGGPAGRLAAYGDRGRCNDEHARRVCPRIDSNSGNLSFLDCDDRALLYCLNMPVGECWQLTFWGHWRDVNDRYIGHVIVIVRRLLSNGQYQYCAVEPTESIELGCFPPCNSPTFDSCYEEQRMREILCAFNNPVGRLNCDLPLEIGRVRDGQDTSQCYYGPTGETPWWECGSYQKLNSMCVNFQPSQGPTLECLPEVIKRSIKDCESYLEPQIPLSSSAACTPGDTTLCQLDTFPGDNGPIDGGGPRLQPLFCCPPLNLAAPEPSGRWVEDPRFCDPNWATR